MEVKGGDRQLDRRTCLLSSVRKRKCFPPSFASSETAANGSAGRIGPRRKDPLVPLNRPYCGMDSCCTCQRCKWIEAREKRGGGQRKTKRDKEGQRRTKVGKGRQRHTNETKDKRRKAKEGQAGLTDRPTCEGERKRPLGRRTLLFSSVRNRKCIHSTSLFRKLPPLATPTASGLTCRILSYDSAGRTAASTHAAPARGARGLRREGHRGETEVRQKETKKCKGRRRHTQGN